MTTITDKATKAISHLDSSRAARTAGDIVLAESETYKARQILIELANAMPVQIVDMWTDPPRADLATLPIEQQVLTELELSFVRRGERFYAIKAIRERTVMGLGDSRALLNRASPRPNRQE